MCASAVAAPNYLIDARGWDGQESARGVCLWRDFLLWPISCIDMRGTGVVRGVLGRIGRTPSRTGDFCQVEFTLDCADAHGNLHLQLYLTDEYHSDQWTGYRFYRLLHAGEPIWEEDIARTRRGGNEWSSIDVSDLAADADHLDLMLQVIDRRPVANYTTTIFVGPIRLVRLEHADPAP